MDLLRERRESLGTRLDVCTYRVITIILPIVEHLVVLEGHGFRINVIYVTTCSWLMAS